MKWQCSCTENLEKSLVFDVHGAELCQQEELADRTAVGLVLDEIENIPCRACVPRGQDYGTLLVSIPTVQYTHTTLN